MAAASFVHGYRDLSRVHFDSLNIGFFVCSFYIIGIRTFCYLYFRCCFVCSAAARLSVSRHCRQQYFPFFSPSLMLTAPIAARAASKQLAIFTANINWTMAMLYWV